MDGECQECRKKRSGSRGERTTDSGDGSDANAMPLPPTVSAVVSSPGRPLEPKVRAEMEFRLGHQLSRVRVHTDARAASSAKSVDARAYTLGRHIVFDGGEYAPETTRGWHLLAHELVHVVQQGSGLEPVPSVEMASEHHPAEREAEKVARAVVDGQAPSARRIDSTPRLYRAKNDLVAYTGGASGSLLVFQTRKPIFTTRAVSGHAGRGEHERNIGPIPTAMYALHPQRTQTTVSKLQAGTCGANAIASGYQEITSNDPSPCSDPPSHYCTVSCPTAADPARKCFTPRDCWGEKRIKIEGSVRVPKPSGGTVTRGGFYIHGGNHSVGVTSGCVKVFDNKAFDEVRKLKGRVPFCVGAACPAWMSAALRGSVASALAGASAGVIGALGGAAAAVGTVLGFGSTAEAESE